MRSEYTKLPLWLHGVEIGYILCDGAGRFSVTVGNDEEFRSIFASLSHEGISFDGIRLELFDRETETCAAEKHSWDLFDFHTVDSYVLTCDVLGPHEIHKNDHTGARWGDPAVPATPLKKEKPMLGPEEIKNRVGPHLLTDATAVRIPEVRQQFENLMNFLDGILPDGRCKDVAFNELETAQMWAVKALALQGPITTEDRETVAEKLGRVGQRAEDIFASPPRTQAEAKYQAGQNAFQNYQNRPPDNNETKCSARTTMGIIFPGTPANENFTLTCTLPGPHIRHTDEEKGYTWLDEHNIPNGG